MLRRGRLPFDVTVDDDSAVRRMGWCAVKVVRSASDHEATLTRWAYRQRLAPRVVDAYRAGDVHLVLVTRWHGVTLQELMDKARSAWSDAALDVSLVSLLARMVSCGALRTDMHPRNIVVSRWTYEAKVIDWDERCVCDDAATMGADFERWMDEFVGHWAVRLPATREAVSALIQSATPAAAAAAPPAAHAPR